MLAGVLSVGAAAAALFILRENIHLGVYSLAATRLFWRFKYLLLWSEGHFIIRLHEKSTAVWFLNDVKNLSWWGKKPFQIPFTNMLVFHGPMP